MRRLSLLPLEDRLTPSGTAPFITAPIPAVVIDWGSKAVDGSQPTATSIGGVVSADGRYLFYRSYAANLVAGDTNGVADIFRRDLVLGTVTRVSVAADGTQANGSSYNPHVSADGRYMSFASTATNLVAGVVIDRFQIFRKDLVTGEVRLASAAADGTVSNDGSTYSSISRDGRFVIFTSLSTNLVAGDTDFFFDVFRKDLLTGAITRASSAADGTHGNDDTTSEAVSADGRYVAFASLATNLVAGDANGVTDIFRKDLLTGQVVLVSAAAGGTQGNGASEYPEMSGDGRYVVFYSFAANLVAGDTNAQVDIFRKDLLTGQMTRVNVAASGAQANDASFYPTVSDDGQVVPFYSFATSLVPSDTVAVGEVFVWGRIGAVALSADENQTAVTTVTATDPDAGTTLTFSLVPGDDGAKFAINPTTGVLTFLAAPDFEAPTDANADNVYVVTVRVTDGTLTDDQAIRVTVTNANDAPTITSSAAVNADENQTAVTAVTATDPDAGTTLTFSVAGGADAAKFVINSTTGVLTFVVAPVFDAPTDANADNVYEVTVQVSDGSLTATRAVSVTVLPVPTLPFAHAFNPTPTGALSAHWLTRTGAFSVASGAAAGTVNAANVATVRSVSAANAGAQTTVGYTAVGQTVGIALRYSGPGATNMYWGTLSALAGGQQQAAIWRNVNGTWTQLAAVNLNSSGGLLRFEANGPSLKLFVNNVRVLTAYDTTPSLVTGGIGLFTGQGGSADDFFAFALGTTAGLPAADNFTASPPLNQLSSQWTEQSGSYSVTGDVATAQSSSLVTGKGNTAVLNGVSAADVTVAATVRPQVGGLLSTGLVARYTGSGDAGSPTATFYWGALNVFGGPPFTQYSAQIWKVVNGVATNLNFNAVPIDPANAVNKELRFEVVGSSLKLFLNNQIVSFAFDTSIAAAGSVGLRTDAGAVLDDFTAAVKPAVTPTLPFTDPFTSGGNAQNSLANTWQERLGVFSVATNRAVALDASTADIATLNGISVGDATIDGTFFFTASGQVGGLVGRYQGTNGTGDSNTYLATAVTLSGGDLQLLLMKNVGGNWTVLGNTTLSGYFPGGNFAAKLPLLRFRMLGTQLSVFLGDDIPSLTLRLSAADSSLASGSVGIRLTQGVGVDNFGVTSP